VGPNHEFINLGFKLIVNIVKHIESLSNVGLYSACRPYLVGYSIGRLEYSKGNSMVILSPS